MSSHPPLSDRRPTVLLPRVLAALLAGLLAVLPLAGCAGGQAPPAAAPATADIARAFGIGGRQVYLECHGVSTPGSPTVLLISGYHDAGDVWDIEELITPPAVGPAVPRSLAAAGHRVCTYDRPGTVRYSTPNPSLTDRSTPVPQPRTAADVVAELHELLRVAEVRGPLVLTAHSLGGLFAQLYARTYPDEVRGVVFVDSFSHTVPAVFGSGWPSYREVLSAIPAGTPLALPESERIDIDASVAQVLAAPALRPMPMVVLTKTEPFQTTLPPPPGLSWAEINRLYESAETDLVKLQPNIPRAFATGSDHYIQWHEPDLVIRTTELVIGRVPR